METNRLRFVDLDTSGSTQTDTKVTGFTVIKAPKGVAKPAYFPQGSTSQILATFGAPSSSYPGIQELLDFNSEYSCWVSAPPGIKTGLTNYYGGVYFTIYKSLESFYQVIDPINPNFNIWGVAAGNSPYSTGSTKTVSGSGIAVTNIPHFTGGNVSSLVVRYPSLANPNVYTEVSLLISGTNITTTGDTPIDVGDVVDAGNGLTTLNISGSTSVPALDFTNTDLVNHLSTYLSGLTVKWLMSIQNDVILTLYQNSPRSTNTTFTLKHVDLRSTIDGVVNPLYNSCIFSFTDVLYNTTAYASGDLTISPDYNAVDGFNSSIYMNDILDGNLFISGRAYKSFADTDNTDTNAFWPSEVTPTHSSILATVSGTRVISNSTLTSSDIDNSLMEGWSLVSITADLEGVNIFMNIENTLAALSLFASLRATTHKFSTFISGLQVSTIDTATAVTDLQAISVPKMTGLAYYCNEFLVSENYSGTEYWTTPIGSVGKMLARIMTVKLGGWAPMFTNTGEGLGGILDKDIKKQKYVFTADQLDALDSSCINPIIYDLFYGVMITSQRTAQSPQILTDWSYLGHQMAFDLFKSELRKSVMIPQIGKPIDNYYMDLRKNQAQTILNQRLVGTTAIWDSGLVQVQEVNTAETKSQNKFIIKVRVKVNPFSETVELIFNNVGQTSSVTS